MTTTAEYLAKARLEANAVKNAASRSVYAIDRAIEALGIPLPVPTPTPTPAPTPAPSPEPDPDLDGETPPEAPTTTAPVGTGTLAAIPGWTTPANGVGVQGGETSAGLIAGSSIDTYAAWGAKLVRIATRSTIVMPGGPPSPLHGGVTIGAMSKWQLDNLYGLSKRALDKGMSVILDNHSYRQIDDPDIGNFWAAFGAALKVKFGGKFPDRFAIELVNEPKSNWPEHARGVKANIKTIRDAGVDCALIVDHGFWSKYSSFPNAMAELDKLGGPEAMDPLNKIIFALHDYPTPSGNDIAKTPPLRISGKITSVKARYGPVLEEARRRKVCVLMTEIGMGGGNGKFLPAEGAGMDGAEFMRQYIALAAEYSDVLKGTAAWGAGRAGTSYVFRIQDQGEHGALMRQFYAA